MRIQDPSGKRVVDSSLGDRLLRLSVDGTYRMDVVFGSYYNRSGDYSFQLLDVASATAMAFDEDIQGTIEVNGSGRGMAFHSVSVSERQYVYFDGKEGSANWTLYTAQGTEVTSGGTTSDKEFWLNPGEYTMQIDGRGSERTDYRFQFITPELATHQLEVGQVVTNSLSEKGERDTYTFEGTAGQQLFFDALNSPRLDIRIRDESGHDIANSSFSDRLLRLAVDGTYQITVSAQYGRTGDYSFQLLDVASATAMAFDEDIQGTIEVNGSGRGMALHSFSVSERQYVYFDGKEGRASWTLYSAQGTQVTSGGTTSDKEFWLNPGEYTMQIDGYGSDRSDYRFQFITPELITRPLEFEQTISNSISEKGEQDTYTFEGTAGQQLFFDALDNPDLTVRIYDERGQRLVDGRFNDRTLRLSTNGTYRVVVLGESGRTGDYSFRLITSASSTAISLDESVSGLVSMGDQGYGSSLYNFSISEKQYVYFDAQQGANTGWSLHSDQGTQVQSGSFYRDAQFWLEAGNYVMRIDAAGSSDYTFQLITPELTTQDLPLGALISDSISEKGERNRYIFEGAVGQRLFLDAFGDSRIKGNIYDPSGVRIVSGSLSDRVLVLPREGEYKIDIYGQDGVTGDYGLQLMDNLSISELSLDETTAGRLAGENLRSDLYRFSGEVGQTFYLNTSSEQYSVQWKLYSPNGEEVSSGSPAYSSSDDYEFELAATGDYLIAVSRTITSAADYSLQLSAAPRTTTSLVLGTSFLEGEISAAGQKNSYLFDGEVGQPLFLESHKEDGVILRLFSPSGRQVFAEDAEHGTVPFTLLEKGRYRLEVDGAKDAVGDYRFSLSDRSQAPSININETFSGQLDEQQPASLYQLDGERGQTLSFNFSEETLDGSVWTLYSPNNQAIKTFSQSSEEFSVALASSGLYSLVGDHSTDASVAYSFNVDETTVSSIPTTGTNTTVVGTLSTDNQVDPYSFSASAGTVLWVDQLSTTSRNIRARLRNPDGSLAFDDHRTDGDVEPIVLQQTGEYVLETYSNRSTTGNWQFQLLELASEPSATGFNSLPLNSIVTGVLEQPKSARVFSFDGQVGQQFVFDGILGNSTDVVIYGPNGEPIYERIYSGSKDSGVITLSQAGMYHVTVANNSYDNSEYAFQLSKLDLVPELPIALRTQDSLRGDGRSNLYTLEAEAGQRLLINVQKGSRDATVEVIHANSSSMLKRQSLSTSSSLEVTFSNTSQYLVKISGDRQTDYVLQAFISDEPTSDIIVPGAGYSDNQSQEGLGSFDVQLAVNDGNGGEARQSYKIQLQPDPENIDPVIITQPETRANLSRGVYRYAIESFDANQDTLRYRLLEAPSGAFIDRDSGELAWYPEGTVKPGEVFKFSVEVSDGRGGIDTQTFEVEAFDQLGTIQGFVFDDVNRNGFLDSTILRGDNPDALFVLDLSGSMGGRSVDWLTADLSTVFNSPMSPLDQEIGSILVLADTLSARGLGDTSQIGVISSGQALYDMNPFLDGIQETTTPLADFNSNGVLDIREILSGNLGSGGSSTDGLETAWDINRALPGDSNIIFMSDGYITVDLDLVDSIKADGVNITSLGFDAGGMETMRMVNPDAILVQSPAEIRNLFSTVDPRIAQEALREDIVVYLDTNNNGILDEDESRQKTSSKNSNAFEKSQSYFTFDNLLPGTYNVRQVVPSGAEQTTPGSGSFVDVVTGLSGDNNVFTHFFGLVDVEGSAQLANQNPVFTSNEPSTPLNVGDKLRYQVTASDVDADSLVFDLSLAPEGMAIDEESGFLVWDPKPDQVGLHSVILRVQDNRGGYDLQIFSVDVSRPNTAPAITSTAGSTAVANLPYEYQVSAQDAGGEVVEYRLVDAPDGMTIDSATGLIRWVPTIAQAGSVDVSVKAVDDKGATAIQPFTITVAETAPNEASTVTSTPRTNVRVNTPYLYQIEANDPNGDPLTYRLVESPEGMTVNADGLVSWVPTNKQQGSNTVQLEISDGRGSVVEQRYELTVGNVSTNSAPEITSTPTAFGVTVNRTYSYDATAADPDGDVVLWQLMDSPSGMSLDVRTGTLRWQPTAAQLGRHTVSLEAIDAQGAFSGQSFELIVRGANTAPLITSIPLTKASTDRLYQYQVRATDAEGNALRFQLLSGPDGMAINEQSGWIEWQPAASQTGLLEISVAVTDTEDASTTQVYQVETAAVAPNRGPAIVSQPTGYALTGVNYHYQIQAQDPDNDALTYELIAGPDSMSIDSTTGELLWNPTVADVGSHTVTVGANDGALGGAQRFTLQVVAPAIAKTPSTPGSPTAENLAPEILSDPEVDATVGTIYRYDLRATDANGDRLTYELTESPEGMTVDQYGRIRWTPTAGLTTEVEVAVSDIYGATTMQRYTLSAASDEVAPVVRVQPSLVPADVDQPVSVYVQATDNIGVTSTTLSVGGVDVPIVNGVYTFTPEEVGDLSAIATATDAAGNTTTTETVIEVRDFSHSGIVPTVSLDALSGQTLTAPTDILGVVQDDNLVSYTLSLAQLGSNDFREIHRGSETVESGVLGKLDTSLFQNDSYTLRLTAEDGNGNVVYVDEIVSIGGDLKLGNFTLSFTDMTLPVSGIPVTVTRTYDSLNSEDSDDFGYGWRLEFRDTDLRTSLGRDEQYETLGIRSKAFEDGTRVYLTMPGGQRQGFTFKARQVQRIEGQPLGIFSKYFYEPVFEADDGVTSELSIRYNGYFSRDANGTYSGFQGSPFNPADPLFGGVYVLTTKEGIEYEIDANTGDLLTAKDTNSNTVTFEENGIYSSTGARIIFGRDAQGRITSATDPAGQSVTYEYDSKGDLVAVSDRNGDTTRFDYNEKFAHYLDEVIDPLGRSGVRSEYNEDGRLSKVIDVNGESVELVYDPENSQQTVEDALGNPTTYVYDARGNVVTEIDAVGKVTKFSYDQNNNTLSETVITDASGPDGWTTSYTYDASGNQTSQTNALGETSYYTYGNYGKLESSTDALGNTTKATYDRAGNVLSKTDAAGNVTNYTYSRSGNVLSIQEGTDNITRYSYDLRGNRTSKTDAMGNTTNYSYDQKGNQLTQSMQVTTPDGVRTLTTKSTYDADDNITSVLDAEGNLTQYEYDDSGNQTAVIDALGRRTESYN